MKQLRLIATAALCALAMFSGSAFASSHREAPAISFDPAADNTDLWAWVKPGTHDRLYIVAAYNPLEEPSGGPNFNMFSDEVLYEIHITRGNSLQDVITYQFTFSTAEPTLANVADLNAQPGGGKEFFVQLAGASGGGFPQQTMRVVKRQNGTSTVIANNVKVAPPNIGPRTYSIVTKGQFGASETAYDENFSRRFVTSMGTTSDQGTVFAGPREDGFYVDLGGIFDLAGLRATGVAQDGVAGYNVHAIALDLPTTLLTGNGQAPGTTPGNATTLGIWASASRRQVSVRYRGGDIDFGPWIQVSRLGLPLINEVVIGLQDKDKWNRSHPAYDVANYGAYFLNPILVRDAEFAGFYNPGGPLAGITPPKGNRTDILDAISLTNIPSPAAHSLTVGDVLRVDMAIDSGFPNGRPILGGTNREQADVTDVLLSLLLTRQLSGVADGVNYNDATFLNESPWLATPWRGSDQGHGKTTP